MEKVRLYVLIFGMGIIALPGFLFLAKVAKLRYRRGESGSEDKSMYEKLRDSKIALDKATSLIQSALEGM